MTVSTYGGSEEYYELLAHGQTPRNFPSGEVIFHQGEQGDCMYLVRDGSVALRVAIASSRPSELRDCSARWP